MLKKEKRSLDHFAELDVSVKETSVCIVDDTGKIVREVRMASKPETLLAVLKSPQVDSSPPGRRATELFPYTPGDQGLIEG